MDIRYQRPGEMEVILNQHDLRTLEANAYTMCRNGLAGHYSKTHLRVNPSLEGAHAGLDGGADVTIEIPRLDFIPPILIGREALTIFGQNPTERLDWYFGEDGGIQINLTDF